MGQKFRLIEGRVLAGQRPLPQTGRGSASARPRAAAKACTQYPKPQSCSDRSNSTRQRQRSHLPQWCLATCNIHASFGFAVIPKKGDAPRGAIDHEKHAVRLGKHRPGKAAATSRRRPKSQSQSATLGFQICDLCGRLSLKPCILEMSNASKFVGLQDITPSATSSHRLPNQVFEQNALAMQAGQARQEMERRGSHTAIVKRPFAPNEPRSRS